MRLDIVLCIPACPFSQEARLTVGDDSFAVSMSGLEEGDLFAVEGLNYIGLKIGVYFENKPE